MVNVMVSFIKRVILVLCAVAAAVVTCFFSNDVGNELNYVEKELLLPLDNYYIDSAVETHGGFLGDGETFYIIKANDDNADIYEQINSRWTELPLSDELDEIVYGSSSMTYDVSIPKIEHGYYYFADRSEESSNGEISNDIHPSRYDLYNFTLSIYDSDNNTLIYYELDT